MTWKIALPLLLLLFPLPVTFAQTTAPQPVLDVTFMDKTADPCVDFYAYSCGGWMKKNPIPPDQSSWNTYSKLQDENLAQLRTILEDAAKGGSARDAATQKIGDYYASCMDEPAIEKLGTQPLQPELDRIARLQSKQDMAEYLSTTQFPPSIYGGGTLFTFRSGQDFKDSTQVIAEADQGGLGLPDRDYYFKDDAKSQELRKAYVAHVQKIFELLGDKPSDAAAEAATVMRIETDLAKGQMTRVERRDPTKLYHRMTLADLEKLAPGFRWTTYFAKTGVGSLQSLNVVTPDYFRTLSAEIEKDSLPDWKTYLRWHAAHHAANYLSSAFVNENFAFYGKTLRGQEQLPPRWKRCTNDVDDDLGEALGQAYVAKYFGPDAKQAAVKMVKEIEAAMESEVQALRWMGAPHQGAGAHQVARDRQQGRLSRPMARLQQAGDCSRRRDRQCAARQLVRVPPLAQQDRQAGGSQRMDHDAAHRQRLLRSAEERHQFPGGHFAAAAVQCEFRRRSELRQYRRHHGPRTHPRLR